MKPLSHTFTSQPTTVFAVMSALATEHNAVNLGQGFPDGEGPEDLRLAAGRYLMEGPNQYPPMGGMPRLRQALAAHDKRFYGLDVDWQTETLVASGATEALADCFLGLINPGDEVVVFEPVYDSYAPMIEAVGGIVKPVQLQPPAWSVPLDDLAAAFSDKTKLVALNTPMNPVGKVFTRDELQAIADLVIAHDAYVVCDEVYEHLVFDGAEHISMMTLPGMDARCARIGSAGKTFSVTGWKVGYITARADLMTAIAKAHQFVTFTTPPALQLAVADGLEKDDAYYSNLATEMQAGRDYLRAGLQEVGFDVLPCDGTYFLTTDFRAVADKVGFAGGDYAFCETMTRDAGVSAIPLSPFYGDPAAAPQHLIRFCFCKKNEVLDEAVTRLKHWIAAA